MNEEKPSNALITEEELNEINKFLLEEAWDLISKYQARNLQPMHLIGVAICVIGTLLDTPAIRKLLTSLQVGSILVINNYNRENAEPIIIH